MYNLQVGTTYVRMVPTNMRLTTLQNGSGLGLPLVHRIVAQHYGTIDMKTEVGKGTKFTIYLPLVQGDPIV